MKKGLKSAFIIAMTALCVMGGSARKTLKVEKPNLEDIHNQVLDPESKYYFPKLEKAYNANDTVMTPSNIAISTWDTCSKRTTTPIASPNSSAPIEELRKKSGKFSKKELDTIIMYSEKVLKDNPFDLRQMSFLVHALKEEKKEMRAKIWEYRLENLLGAIKSTGTGEDIDNAWYVIYPMHEYDMIQLLGYEATDAEYPTDGIDKLIVQPTAATTKRLRGKTADCFYFNVAIPQEQYDLKHPDEAEEIVPDTTTTANDDDVRSNPY